MAYQVHAVRARFPALEDGTAYFDGPGGTQVPDSVIEAMAATLRGGVSNRGRVTGSESRAEECVHQARSAMADLLGAVPSGIVFGRSMTQLTYDFARTLAKTWAPGDEIVLTGLEHDANFRPWTQAARDAGVTVRIAEFSVPDGNLATEAVTELLTERTKLVAVTGASNLIGTRPDLPAITEAARAVGALSYVDGVHLTPHEFIDIGAIGADCYVCSPYKFLGPHLGVLAAVPELLETLRPDKLLPATDVVPERFEFGTLPYELLAGTTAAVDFLAELDGSAHGTRRERLRSSMAELGAHEDALARKLENGLRELGVRLYGEPDRSRTPTVLFSHPELAPGAVHAGLAERGVNAPEGSFYAYECARRLGLESGATRAGIAPYTDESEVDRLIAGVAALLG